MNRLTNKYCNNYGDFVFSLRNSLTTHSELNNGIYKKLKQLEDIGEELGIDLRILFKALKNGFYYYSDNGIVHTSDNESYISLQAQSCLPNQMCIEVDYDDYSTMCFYFIDYGKTWALTREELEENR